MVMAIMLQTEFKKYLLRVQKYYSFKYGTNANKEFIKNHVLFNTIAGTVIHLKIKGITYYYTGTVPFNTSLNANSNLEDLKRQLYNVLNYYSDYPIRRDI